MLGVRLPFSNAVFLRSEPNSRNALEHEQCYPSQLLHQEDALSRHRGRKPTLQYELSGGITLLSPAYLLSIKRHSFHKVMPDHYKHGKFVSLPSCSSYHSYSPASFIAIIL